jgi:uncharacterized protein YjiS (DUF1127 family)
MNLDSKTVPPRRLLRWRQLKQVFMKWRRARSRTELTSLSDRCLRDIGVSRRTVDVDAWKPFWGA